MATLSSPGIGSGLDVNSIISQLVAIERQPLQQLQREASSLQTRLSTYGQIKSALSAVRDAAAALARASAFTATTGTSSDPSAVAVTTGSGTLSGSYAIEVQSLASVQSNATGVYASAGALVGEGVLHIQLGSYGAGQTTFTGAGPEIAVDVGPPADSLASLRDKINAANAGVVASVLNDANGARLVLRSAATGAANAFRIRVDDPGSSGLSALAFDPSVGITTLAQALAAANASAMLNGLPVSSASNTLNEVVDGIKLSLGKVTAGAVQVDVKPDQAATRKALDAFVTAYNSLNTLISEQTKYDATTRTAGLLQGDSAAVSIRSQLRNLVGANGGISTRFARLADIGFDVQNDGSIKLNETKIATAVANPAELQKLFANTDLAVPANNGVATQLRNFVDQLLGADGTISNRSEGLRKRIDLNSSRQTQLNERAEAVEARLRAQYTALDRQLASLTGLSTYVNQQFGPNSNFLRNGSNN
jgi:flagellar hook-associated protein 2